MDAVEDIKGRLSIEDVVGRYVELKRAGRNFRGLSPFTNEKTPSFMVSPEKQIWHDFSSGKGGNMFSFVMEMEGLDFKGALELLARQAGVDLSQYRSAGDGQRSKQKARLTEIMELATKYYQVQFSKNTKALEYILKKRKFSKQTALEFRIGYSPNSQDGLSKFLVSKGFKPAEIKAAGLATTTYKGTTDMFRGRIMIPLMDSIGRVVGFTARLLEDDPNQPKYINTPATPLYDKSRHVYGLNLAKEAIRKARFSVVAEGNLDVIASHQAGVKQVVATAGTAVTEMQLKELGRFSEDVRLAFDQDEAGIKAAERSIAVAAKANINLSMITVTGAKDPDELIQKDPKKWEEAVTKPKYALDWLMDHYKKQLDITSAQGKRQFSDVILPIVRQLSDQVEQDHYIGKVAKLIDVSNDSLRAKMGQKTEAKIPLKRAKPQPKLEREDTERIKTQNQLLALCLMAPEIRPVLEKIDKEMLDGDDAREVLKLLKQPDSSPELTKLSGTKSKVLNADAPQGGHETRSESYQEYGERVSKQTTKRSTASASGVGGSAGKQGSTVESLRDYVKILVLLYEETYQGLDTHELQYEATRLQSRLVAKYVKTQKEIIASDLRQSTGAKTTELLNKAKELDKLLNFNKEAVNG